MFALFLREPNVTIVAWDGVRPGGHRHPRIPGECFEEARERRRGVLSFAHGLGGDIGFAGCFLDDLVIDDAELQCVGDEVCNLFARAPDLSRKGNHSDSHTSLQSRIPT